LVNGSFDCAYGNQESFNFQGTWQNPGLFDSSTAVLADQPDKTKAIAEIKFTTFGGNPGAGYVLEYTTGTFSPTQQQTLTPHYSVDFPCRTCRSPCAPPGQRRRQSGSPPDRGATTTQAAIGLGVGKPRSAQLRALQLSATQDGLFASTGYVVDDSNPSQPTQP